MQVNLGEKIRELRKKDGRKQEDLAKALGVTSQAVSRWEANGGYPDIGMIPVIANYFHITIDELFGYDNDREQKVQEYYKQAILMMTNGQDTLEIIAFLRKGMEEFPTESRLKDRLAYALVREGWKHQDEKPNQFWAEAAALFEEIVVDNPNILESLVDTYTLLGQIEKAEETAAKQHSISLSREVLLAKIFDSKRGDEYRGGAVLELLHELCFLIETAVACNDNLRNTREGLEILSLERELLAKVLGEDCFGYYNDLCFVDSQRVTVACNIKDYDAALQYFDLAFAQCMKAENWKRMKQPLEDQHFGTTILRNVNPSGKTVRLFEKKFLVEKLDRFPANIAQQIKNNPKYRELFED